MRKCIISFVLSLLVTSPIMAQEESLNENNKKETTTDTKQSSALTFGVLYFSFDGFENYGFGVSSMEANKWGFDLTYRQNFKKHGNWNCDFGPNYSFELYSENKTNVFFTLGAAASVRVQEEFEGIDYDKHGNPKEKWSSAKTLFDAVLSARLFFSSGHFAISGGYVYWAPKFKFGKDYKADGWVVSLGYNF